MAQLEHARRKDSRNIAGLQELIAARRQQQIRDSAGAQFDIVAQEVAVSVVLRSWRITDNDVCVCVVLDFVCRLAE